MAFVEVQVDQKFADKFSDELPYLSGDKPHVGMLNIYSNGKVAMINQPHLYTAGESIMREYRLQILNVQTKTRFDKFPFHPQYGRSLMIEEPTTEAIEEKGILHKRD